MFTTKLGRLFLACVAGLGILAAIVVLTDKGDDLGDPHMVGFYDALANVKHCYETALGNVILEGSAKCPPKDLVDKAEADYMRRFSALPSEIKHDGAVFVNQLIDCGKCSKCRALGCTNGRDIVVLFRSGWERTYMVELGHVVSLYRHGEIDPDHYRPLYP